MRKDYLIVGIVIIVGVLLYSRLEKKPSEASMSAMPVQVVDDQNIRQEAPKKISGVTEQPKTNLPTPEVKSESNPVLAENFRIQLNKVSECVDEGSKSNLANGVNPNFESLIQVFNNRYGQYVVSLEDWVQSDVRMSDGTLRRVRVDTTYIDQASPERRVSVFSIDQSGNPQIMAIDPEKSFNPDEEYISSFTTGATPMLIEKSQRVYFQNGEELILIERNGVVESITFSANGKTATCTALDRDGAECQCY